MTYNGWSNWATWMINLHFSNDEYMQEKLQELADEASADLHETYPDFSPGQKVNAEDADDIEYEKDKAVSYLVELLNDLVIDTFDQLNEHENSLLSDVISGFISEIDFYEWAKALLEF